MEHACRNQKFESFVIPELKKKLGRKVGEDVAMTLLYKVGLSAVLLQGYREAGNHEINTCATAGLRFTAYDPFANGFCVPV